MEIRRDFYLEKLIKKKHNGLIKVITGIRRCSKSYLLNNIFYHHLLDSGVPADHKALAISLGLPVGQPNKQTGPVSDSEIAMIALRFLERFVKSNQKDLSVRQADR